MIFHGREKLPTFQFLAEPEKTALHLCLFPRNFQKIRKIFEYFEKSEKMGLQQENPHKNDDFSKIGKKATFFLKNRSTVNKF